MASFNTVSGQKVVEAFFLFFFFGLLYKTIQMYSYIQTMGRVELEGSFAADHK